MADNVLQRYQITERIDAGGMAEVFKAKVVSIKGFEKEVAIKRILPSLTQDPRFVRMFLDEAKLSLYLSHTNIVQVFDIGQADGTFFIVMEFIDGTNLKNILNALAKTNTRLPVEQAIYICIRMCEGLSYAHEKRDPDGQPLKVVHRDISPPNILISRDGEVKITDFGLAKAVIQIEQTDPGIVKGKFGYLSPEAAFGEEVDLRTDLFAIGIVLWEMFAGRRLFLGKTDLKTLELVREAKIPSIRQINPNVPAGLEAVLLKALARDRDSRFKSAREFGQALSEQLFAMGKPVTSYQLSAQVEEVLLHYAKPAVTQEDLSVIDILIQNEMDKFISLEEMADLNELNLVGAKPLTVDDLENRSSQSDYPAYGFEDPRTWSDDTLGEDSSTAIELDLTQRPNLPEPPSALTSSGKIEHILRPGQNDPESFPESFDEISEEPVETPKTAWIVFIILLTLVMIGLIALIVTLLMSG